MPMFINGTVFEDYVHMTYECVEGNLISTYAAHILDWTFRAAGELSRRETKVMP